jgi:hypothetical protein
MIFNRFYRIGLILIILLIALGNVGWMQSPSPAQAVFSAEDEALDPIVEVIGPPTAEPITSVTVGDTFEVNVVVRNIPEPGIFGYQFLLNWDSAVVSPINVTTSSDFPIRAKAELGESTYELAASRKGNVGDIIDSTDPITLLTVEFQADAATDPETTSLTLTEVKLGRKGGFDVPVGTVNNLDVVIVDLTNGDMKGNVKVEGRAADNQAGHSIVSDNGLSTLTETDGNFSLVEAEFGTYDLAAKSPGFLTATCEGVVHENVETPLEGVELLAGDIDDSGGIDITDAVAIGAEFGNSGSGEVSDLNVDDEVDILDLILMAANFGQISEDNPWVCQSTTS